jgi:WD40 repeat protein
MGAGCGAGARGANAQTSHEARPNAARPVLSLLQSDVVELILELAGSPCALLVTKAVTKAGVPAFRAVCVRLWQARVARGAAMLGGSAGGVLSCAFSPDGQSVETRYLTFVRIYDAETGAPRHAPESRGSSLGAFSRDGRRVARRRPLARLWAAATGAPLKKRGGVIYGRVYSPDGRKCAEVGPDDDTVRLWDASGEPLAMFKGHAAAVVSIAWSPDGKRLVTGSRDETTQLWDADTGKMQITLRGTPMPSGAARFLQTEKASRRRTGARRGSATPTRARC